MASSFSLRTNNQATARYMMKLGHYVFSVHRAAYQTLSRTTQYRWQAQERVGRLAAQQFTGRGEDSITLNGIIYPHFQGGLGQVYAMRIEAGRGRPLMLVDGMGRIWNRWVINQIEETQSVFDSDGRPRSVEFRLQLSRYGEDYAIYNQ